MDLVGVRGKDLLTNDGVNLECTKVCTPSAGSRSFAAAGAASSAG